MRRHLAVAVGMASLWGCGSSGESTGPTTRPLSRQATYDENGAGRDEVARVDGVPIYADCVAHQAAGRSLPEDRARQVALDECIAFELLAQEARRRALTSDPDAAEAQKREAVRALIDQDFGPTLDDAQDIPRADLERHWPKLERFFNHGELRTTFYCRVKLPRNVKTGGPEDLEAGAYAAELYAQVAGRAIDKAALHALCEQGTSHRKMEINRKPYTFELESKTNRAYSEAAFALPSIGRVSPATRTAWGWDLILVTRIEPPMAMTFEQALPELQRMFFYDHDFEGYRQTRFLGWASTFARGLRVAVYPERVPAATDPLAEALGVTVPPAAAGEPAPPGTAPMGTNEQPPDGPIP